MNTKDLIIETFEITSQKLKNKQDENEKNGVKTRFPDLLALMFLGYIISGVLFAIYETTSLFLSMINYTIDTAKLLDISSSIDYFTLVFYKYSETLTTETIASTTAQLLNTIKYFLMFIPVVVICNLTKNLFRKISIIMIGSTIIFTLIFPEAIVILLILTILIFIIFFSNSDNNGQFLKELSHCILILKSFDLKIKKPKLIKSFLLFISLIVLCRLSQLLLKDISSLSVFIFWVTIFLLLWVNSIHKKKLVLLSRRLIVFLGFIPISISVIDINVESSNTKIIFAIVSIFIAVERFYSTLKDMREEVCSLRDQKTE